MGGGSGAYSIALAQKNPQLSCVILDVPTAVRIGHALEPFGIAWFEEPIPPGDLDGLAEVARALEGQGPIRTAGQLVAEALGP